MSFVSPGLDHGQTKLTVSLGVSHYVLIIPCSTNVIRVRVLLGRFHVFNFSLVFYIFGIILANSYPTRKRGIIVNSIPVQVAKEL